MTLRRVVQSLLALTLCVALALWLGRLYLVPAVGATAIALSTGVYITLAIAVGLVWPVLALAFVAYVTSDAKLRAQTSHDRSRHAATAQTDSLGVEDP